MANSAHNHVYGRSFHVSLQPRDHRWKARRLFSDVD
jgi:hypothetical protein